MTGCFRSPPKEATLQEYLINTNKADWSTYNTEWCKECGIVYHTRCDQTRR